LERHRTGEACVIPIIIRHCAWKQTPLHELQALPAGGKPIMSWLDQDEAFLDVTEGIQKVVDELTTNNLSITSTPANSNYATIPAVKPIDFANTITVTQSSAETTSVSQVPLLDKTTKVLPPLRSPFPLPPFIRKFPRQVHIALVSIIIFMLVLGTGGIFVLPSLLHQSPNGLCSGNFQSASANTPIGNMPATSTSPDGETIGLSEGEHIFDCDRPDQNEVQDKLQAAQDIANNPQDVVPSLKNAISRDQTDAEAQIYLENRQVLGSNHPRITFVLGVSFILSYSSHNVLQGAFTAQKEYNDLNRQDASKTLIVLMIANVGGDVNGNITNESAKFVANQIADQADKDPTIVGIMGWPLSAATLDVQDVLKKRLSDLPMLAACSASDDLTGTYHFFRVCPTDKKQSQVAAEFLLKRQKKKIAILYQLNNSWSYSLQNDFTDAISKANTIGPESYTSGDQGDIQRALNKVLTHNPDTIFFAGYPKDLIILLKVINTTPLANNLFIMGGSALSMTNAYSPPLPDLHNVDFTAFASPNQWDGIDSKPPFFQEYQNNFGIFTAPTGFPSIDAGVMFGYDGMSTLLHATQQVLSKQNTINASDLEKELKNITGSNAIQGVTGRIAFNKENGDQDEHKMVFVEHTDGANLVIDEQHGCLVKDSCGS
jgi:ABC-type branched-subunit amino acid transport system substrate-binding protein